MSDKKESSVTSMDYVRKEDTQALVVDATDNYPPDAYAGLYAGDVKGGGPIVLKPTYNPAILQALTRQNNTLSQCIEAMEVNVDGTGHSIDLVEGAVENEEEKQILVDFFKDPYPGTTMISIRRKLRVDLEAGGNAYLEVIRNIKDEIVLINHIEAASIRLVRYDNAVSVERALFRGGREVKVQLRARERRFVQLINGKKVYFREFNASRNIDRNTGQWIEGKENLAIDRRGSEILHFTLSREPRSAYAVPRWINQLPSVLGSRKAEEFNLDFFDAGGLPPVLIMIMGGYLGEQVKENLQNHLSNKGNKHRAAIIEAISSSGSIDSAGSVKVAVERFGSDRMSDAMFQQYDKNTEQHVREAFRLPPMFVGKAADYNFATAYTAYMVAEAQVFGPERQEFDAIINTTIVRALGVRNYVFRSKPLTLVDVERQIKAVKLVAGTAISEEELVSVLNEITGLSLTYEKQEQIVPTGSGVQPVMTAKREELIQEKEQDLEALATAWIATMGLGEPLSEEQRVNVRNRVLGLEEKDVFRFNEIVAEKTLDNVSLDLHGLGDLCGGLVNMVG